MLWHPTPGSRGLTAQWNVWHQWTFEAFAAPQFQRHVACPLHEDAPARLEARLPVLPDIMASMLYVMSTGEANLILTAPRLLRARFGPVPREGCCCFSRRRWTSRTWTNAGRSSLSSSRYWGRTFPRASLPTPRLARCYDPRQNALSRHGEVTRSLQVVQGALVQPCTALVQKVVQSVHNQGKWPAVHLACTLILEKLVELSGAPPSAGPAAAMSGATASTHHAPVILQRVTYTIPRHVPVRILVAPLPAEAVHVRWVPVPPAQARQVPTVPVGPMHAFSARPLVRL